MSGMSAISGGIADWYSVGWRWRARADMGARDSQGRVSEETIGQELMTIDYTRSQSRIGKKRMDNALSIRHGENDERIGSIH